MSFLLIDKRLMLMCSFESLRCFLSHSTILHISGGGGCYCLGQLLSGKSRTTIYSAYVKITPNMTYCIHSQKRQIIESNNRCNLDHSDRRFQPNFLVMVRYETHVDLIRSYFTITEWHFLLELPFMKCWVISV